MNIVLHKFINGFENKMCSCCKMYKILNQFGIDNNRYDKLNTYCCMCKKQKSKLSRNKNIEKIREYGRKRYYRNRERLLTQSNKYHYKKRCDECGGETKYLKIKSKFKNKINEGLTFIVLQKLLPNIDIKHNKHKIYTVQSKLGKLRRVFVSLGTVGSLFKKRCFIFKLAL